MKYQARINIGKFGKVVYYTSPRKWKWLVELEAAVYCYTTLKETTVTIFPINSKPPLSGKYIQHDDGNLEML